jgi:L-fuculose-phosphate aldolase
MAPHDELREAVWRAGQRMWRAGLVVASAGNISARSHGDPSLIAVTPTSIEYEVMLPDDIAIVTIDGSIVDAPARPTSELPMHLAILRARSDAGAVVHTHAPSVSVLSILRRPLPPVIDEMMICFGGTVEVAEYAFTGGEDLGASVVAALGDRSAAILSNHGNVCVGRDLDDALHLAVTMEACARSYVEALRCGVPVELPPEAVATGRKLYLERK